MSKLKHTPGPWSTHIISDETPRMATGLDGKEWFYADSYIGAGKKMLAEVKYSTSNAGYPSVGNHEEFLANARLMVAAPELLEALQGILSLDTSAVDDDLVKRCQAAREKADAAISKATGASS